ncbi:MAG TPA: energy transducer TonB [Pyrinomonadaceae bacterium]|nr:energy transducer TonB [Pyrinomonadaceae bacterium]
MKLILASLLCFSWLLSIGLTQPNPQTPAKVEGPRVLAFEAPTYPKIAAAAHASGKVIFEVEIDSKGDVVASERISGHPLLVNATREAVVAWKFEAATKAEPNRKIQLEFDFDVDAPRCRPFTVITPYRLRIAPSRPAETISYVRDADDYCEKHRERMSKDRLKIIYGLTTTSNEFLQAAQKHFPNANSSVSGGCDRRRYLRRHVCADESEVRRSSLLCEMSEGGGGVA